MHVPQSEESQTGPSAAGLRVGVVVSRYHRDVTDALLAGARDAFARSGGRDGDLVVAEASGAFELPVIAQVLADDPDIAGVVTLGCVVSGETRHDEYLCAAVANALQQVALSSTTPVSFGLLTVANLDQARARAGGDHGNKGAEAMTAVLATIRTLEALCGDKPMPEALC